MKKSPYRVGYRLGAGWNFSLTFDGKQRHFNGFQTEWQAIEARLLAEQLRREGKPVPTPAELRKVIPAYLERAAEHGTVACHSMLNVKA